MRDAQTELCLLPGHIDAVPLVVINWEVWKFQACWSRAQIPEEGHFSSPHLHCQEISLGCRAWAGVSPQARLWAWPLTRSKGILTAFSLFLKSKTMNTKKDLLLSLNAPLHWSWSMTRRIVLETVATVGHRCPPPFPGMALHGASHEVLQENSLGVSSLYRGHKEGVALVFLPSLKRQRVNVNHARRQKPWSPTAPTDLCFAPWVLRIHCRWHLCLLVSSAQGSDPCPTDILKKQVFPRGLALWEPRESQWVDESGGSLTILTCPSGCTPPRLVTTAKVDFTDWKWSSVASEVTGDIMESSVPTAHS